MATAAKKKPTAKPAVKPATKTAAKKPAGKVVPIVPQNVIITLPLRDLVLSSKYNVRTNDNSDITSLAASIKTIGLKQNLIVVPQLDAKGKPTGIHEVSAGGRRYRALKLLEKQRDITGDYLVNCEIEAAENAIMSSAAENTMREPMHAADQYEAFRRMIEEQGKSLEETAAAFGVTPAVVKQRLKLANVSPKLLQLFRKGDLELESVMAYALVDDHDLQEQVHEQLKWEADNVYSIKRALTKNDISSRDELAKYVGIDAYEAAGGTVRRDLFSEECWFTNSILLKKLANEKLGKAASKAKKEGWGFADIKPKLEHNERWALRYIEPEMREATKEEAQQLQELESARIKHENTMAELEAKIEEAAGNGEDFDDLQDSLDSAEQQRDAAEEQISKINTARAHYTDEQKQAAGCIVTIENGKTKIYRAVKPATPPSRTEDGASSDDEGATSSETTKPKAQGLSQAMVQRLIAQRSVGLQACLARQPKIALAMVTAQLLGECLGDKWRFTGALNIYTSTPGLHRADPDIEESPAWKAVEAHHERIAQLIPEDAQDNMLALTKWLLQQDTETQLAILAYAAANFIDAGLSDNNNRREACGNAMSSLLGLDMHEWWQPTVQSYLGLIPKPLMVAAVTEACDETAARDVAGQKKGPAAELAATKLEGTGWLPEILRTITSEEPAP